MLSKMLHLIMWVIEYDSKTYTDGRVFFFELTYSYLGRFYHMTQFYFLFCTYPNMYVVYIYGFIQRYNLLSEFKIVSMILDLRNV